MSQTCENCNGNGLISIGRNPIFGERFKECQCQQPTFDQVHQSIRDAGASAWDNLDPDQELAAMRGTPQGIEAIVCDDITERQALGIAKYGKTVAASPLDLRAWLQHAYEECLDQSVYLRRAIAELDRIVPATADVQAAGD